MHRNIPYVRASDCVSQTFVDLPFEDQKPPAQELVSLVAIRPDSFVCIEHYVTEALVKVCQWNFSPGRLGHC